jgi:YD repeat-containing protein
VTRFTLLLATLLAIGQTAFAQLQTGGSIEPVRVTVSMNQDGSRTAYEFDQASRKAVATTNDANGKLVTRIRYELDDAGRFAKGQVFGADEKLRFKTLYKYDGSGRLEEETQLTPADSVKVKLVYSYGADGKQTGYSVYDGAGKLLGQTKPKAGASAAAADNPQPTKKKAR